MKKGLVFAFAALFFFACSSDNEPNDNISSDSRDNNSSSSSNGGSNNGSSSSENFQVYYGLTAIYNGSGTLKEIVTNREIVPIDTIEVGTLTEGIMNLSLYTPEHLDEEGMHRLVNLRIYDSVEDTIIGSLALLDLGYLQSSNDKTYAYYVYYSDNYKYAQTYSSSNPKYVYDYDVKKGWNLSYYNSKTEGVTTTITMTNNIGVFGNREMRWYFVNTELSY